MRKIVIGIAFLLAFDGGASAQKTPAEPAVNVSIDWSPLGIPHIQAFDEKSLGYGIGYAYAADNVCLLADEVITVRGERAKFFGRDGHSSTNANNVESDFFFRWLNDDYAVTKFVQAQPEPIRQLLIGYASGFNRYLRDTAPENLPAACRGGAWLRPLRDDDLARLIRRLLVEGGVGQFAEAVVSAKPPSAEKQANEKKSNEVTLSRYKNFAQSHGSNAIAVGGSRTENGKGRLLANPHFPWSGGLRFYQMHLTIPGRLDAMGAALPGFPMINIGFNRNVAWTHTVDASSHFTLHRLRLDANNATTYIVDGQSIPLKKTIVTIPIRETNGQTSTQTRTIYESRFGPVITAAGLDWNKDRAYALQDANLANTRAPAQWYAMNQAFNLAVFRKAVLDIQGIPWVNTLAADDRGQALYMNVSVVPNIPADRLSECADATSQALGLPGFDGSRSACDWQVDKRAPQPGIVAANRMPILQRDDFVQSSNDSAWMTNPAMPLTGFSPLIARQDGALRLRTRFALTRLATEQIATRKPQPLSENFLQALVSDNHVYAADLIIDDLLNFCKLLREGDEINRACTAMAAWDRTANLKSDKGFLYFQAFMREFKKIENGWKQSFNPQDPLRTPNGLATSDATVVSQIKSALRAAVRQVDALRLPADVTWGDIQIATRGNTRIPIPGGDGTLGIYNAIDSVPVADHREVINGSSYIQLVSFDEQGPVAHGLLTFSQSANPASPHAADQTLLFSQQQFSQQPFLQQWPLMPFTAEQIAANPPVKRIQLRE